MKEFTINFDEIAVTCTKTKAQVVISENDYKAIANNTLTLEDIIDNYEAKYGSIYEEEFEIEELKVVNIFESEVK